MLQAVDGKMLAQFPPLHRPDVPAEVHGDRLPADQAIARLRHVAALMVRSRRVASKVRCHGLPRDSNPNRGTVSEVPSLAPPLGPPTGARQSTTKREIERQTREPC